MKHLAILLASAWFQFHSIASEQISIEETKAYIKTNLENQEWNCKFKVSFEGDKMTLIAGLKEVTNGNVNWHTTTYAFNLSKLDPSGVAVWDYKVLGRGVLGKCVHLRTTSGEKVITSSDSRANGRSEIDICYFDENLAARLAKAFVHAISLSGGKYDPFAPEPADSK